MIREGGRMRCKRRRGLLRLALLLLSDADLEVLLLGFLEGLVIVARDSIGQIRTDVRAARKNDHDREVLIASGAVRAEAFDVRNCHTSSGYHLPFRCAASVVK